MKQFFTLILSSLILSTHINAQEKIQKNSTLQNEQIIESVGVEPQSQCNWENWEQFKNNYLYHGRIIDNSDPRLISTSEGQSYGLFLSLIANDQKSFEEILNWTEKNLSNGDLTARLPAWLWGIDEGGHGKIIDQNSASDSDLWIAYSLLEAGRLWRNNYYQSLGYLLALRILNEETIFIEGYGQVLLPGDEGFILGKNHVRINPSYIPIQLLTRMAQLYPDWQSILESSEKILLETMPKGISPDWSELTESGVLIDQKTQGEGDYDAIRTYLWGATLSEKTKVYTSLIKQMEPIVDIIKEQGYVPETFNSQTGDFTGHANLGLTSSMLPLLMATGETRLAQDLNKEIRAKRSNVAKDKYYQNVLLLISQSWIDGRYQFDENGQVIPSWIRGCRE